MEDSRRLWRFIVRRGVGSAGALASLGLLLSTIAGRLDIPGFWITEWFCGPWRAPRWLCTVWQRWKGPTDPVEEAVPEA